LRGRWLCRFGFSRRGGGRIRRWLREQTGGEHHAQVHEAGGIHGSKIALYSPSGTSSLLDQVIVNIGKMTLRAIEHLFESQFARYPIPSRSSVFRVNNVYK
jgi:hypothetical protein